MAWLFFLLLLSGLVTFGIQTRAYYTVNTTMTWDQAQEYCRGNRRDLATIGNITDQVRLTNEAVVSGESGPFWICLRLGTTRKWKWSMGESENSGGVAQYTNWKSSEPTSLDRCGSFVVDGTWQVIDCTVAALFICFDGQKPSGQNYVLYSSIARNWRGAQLYCRTSHTDLASSRNATENAAIQKIVYATFRSGWVWFGLFNDAYEWSDQSTTTFRYWAATQPNPASSCIFVDTLSKSWWNNDCNIQYPFYCNDVTTIRQVGVELTADPSLNINDQVVQDDMLQQIKTQMRTQGLLEATNMTWMRLSDGNIFHKKEERKKTEL